MTDYNDKSAEKELEKLRVALLNFILSLIVVTNATSAVVNQDLCEQAKEFTYMKCVFWVTAGQLLLLIAVIVSKKMMVVHSDRLQTIATIYMIAATIAQFVLLGKVCNAYPTDYIMFYQDFWDRIRAGCVEEKDRWVYEMMDVIIKITTTCLILCAIRLALELIYCLMLFCRFRGSSKGKPLLPTIR